ncbi:MAG: hypothetical protein QM803_15510 [Rhodocyclaceae bacterium]
MKKTHAIQLAAGAALAFSALVGASTASAVMSSGYISTNAFNKIQPGESRDQVVAMVGQPERTVTWPLTHTQTMYYTTDDTGDFSNAVAHVDLDSHGKVIGTDISADDAEE